MGAGQGLLSQQQEQITATLAFMAAASGWRLAPSLQSANGGHDSWKNSITSVAWNPGMCLQRSSINKRAPCRHGQVTCIGPRRTRGPPSGAASPRHAAAALILSHAARSRPLLSAPPCVQWQRSAALSV